MKHLVPTAVSSALWPAGGTLLCAEAGGYLMPLLLGPMAATYAIGEAAAGGVLAVQLGAFAVAAIALAPRLGALSPRRGALLALLLIVAGNLLSASQPVVWSLVCGRVLAGLGEGMAAAVAAAAIARKADPDRAFARVFIAVVLMTLAIFLLLPGLVAGQDARLLFLGAACVPMLAIPAALALPDRVEVQTPAAARVRGPYSVRALQICAAITLYSVSANSYWVYVERIATGIGMSPEAFGKAFAIGVICALAGPVAAERLGTRWGRVPPLTVGCVLLAIGGWLSTHATTPLLLTVGVTVSSAALLFGTPYLLGLAAMVDPSGRVAGAGRGFNNVGSAIAPALAAGILGATGAYTSFGWISVAAAAGALALVLLSARRAPQAAG